MKLRLLGDIHGDIQPVIYNYAQRDDPIRGYDQLIQIGDFGFKDTYQHLKEKFDPTRLRIVAGNHDDYNAMLLPDNAPYFLGDFGLLPGSDGKVFFVRGAWSIDRDMRIANWSWWYNEELNWQQANECLDLWEKVGDKVELVLTHEAPINVASMILKSYPIETLTGKMLFEMLKMHEPKMWRFGHWHQQWQKQLGKTNFRCLAINQAETIEV